MVWCLAGFLLSYILFFLISVFFSGSTMFSPPVVPTLSPIGADLREIMNFVRAAPVRGGTPYIRTAKYPPLSYLILMPRCCSTALRGSWYSPPSR